MSTPIFFTTNYGVGASSSPDHGFQPSWANLPPTIFDPSQSVSRDQLLGTTRRPIWEESKERFEREEAARKQLQQELDRSDQLALNSVATLFNVASSLVGAVGATLVYAGKVIGAVGNGAAKVREYVATRRSGAERFDPIGRKGRKRNTIEKVRRGTLFDSDSEDQTEDEDNNEDDNDSDSERHGTESMLAMPPHMVGATP